MSGVVLMAEDFTLICAICRKPISGNPSSYRGDPVHGGCWRSARRRDRSSEVGGRWSRREILDAAHARARAGIGDQQDRCHHTQGALPCADCLLGEEGEA